MMRVNNKLMPILLIVALAASAYAECPPDCSAVVDYSTVDWSTVDFTDPNIYKSDEFYQHLPADKYDEIDYNLVDFSKIPDHTKIDGNKYLQQMGCSGCTFSWGQARDAGVTFSKNGISHSSGDFISVPGNYPPGVKIESFEGGLKVIPPEGDGHFSWPDGDSMTVDTQGRNIKLTEWLTVDGVFDYEGGRYYAAAGRDFSINGVTVHDPAKSGLERVEIYFDGERHGGDYVSFANDRLIVQGNNVHISFNKGNRYVGINPAENDRFEVTALNGGGVEISVGSGGTPPKLRVNGPAGAEDWANIKNGVYDITLGPDKADARASELDSSYGSAEVYIITQGESPEGIVVDNENNIVYRKPTEAEAADNAARPIIPESMPPGTFSHAPVGARELVSRFPEISFEGVERLSPEQVNKLNSDLERLKREYPNLYNSLDTLYLHREEGRGTGAHLMTDGEGRVSINSLTDYSFNYEILVHEAAHLYHADLNRNTDWEFNKKWYAITGNGDADAGKNMYYNIHGGEFFEEMTQKGWNQDEMDRRRNELASVSDYGLSNINEDIAEYMRLMAMGNTIPGYNENPVVRNKVALLCSEGFVPGSNPYCSGLSDKVWA